MRTARAALVVLLALAALLAIAPAAGAQRLRSRTQWLLDEVPDPEALRARLLALADSAGRRDSDAGEAWFYVGRTRERAGALDSAIAAYRRANDLSGTTTIRLGFVDALMLRHGPDDAALAERIAARELAEAAQGNPPLARQYAVRRAWALHLLGRDDEAAALLAPHEEAFSTEPAWRERLAAVARARGQTTRARALLLPLAVASRGADDSVMSALRPLIGPGPDAEVGRAISRRDQVELVVLDRLGARRVRFVGSDGFSLGGTVVAPGEGRRRPAIVAVRAPGDTLPDWDSLAVAIRASGRALLLLDLRGHGESLGPECALPHRWAGREAALSQRCALDVRDALHALARVAPVDTARYVVIGSGRAAPIALEAAEADARVQSVVLLSPQADPVERGAMRARIQRMQIPVYLQPDPEDPGRLHWVESLYQAGDRARSRVADVRGAGTGPAAMRQDAEAVTRLVQWLDARASERARPAPRRK